MKSAAVTQLLRLLAALRIADSGIGQRFVGISIEIALVRNANIPTKLPDANKSYQASRDAFERWIFL